MGIWQGRNGLFVAAFWMDFSLGVVIFAVPLVAIDLGAGPLELGLIGASAFVYTVFCLLGGKASEELGRRGTALLGAFTTAAIALSIARVQSIPWLLMLVFCSSAGIGLFWPSLQAWLAEQRDRRALTHGVGAYNIAWSTGLTVGPLISGLLRSVGPRAPLYAGAAGYLSVALLLLAVARPQREEPEELAEAPPIPVRSALSLLHVAWVCNFASWFMATSVRNLFPKLAKDLALSETILSVLIASVGVAQVACFAALWRGRWWHYKLWPMLAFQGLGALGMLLVLTGHTWQVFALGMLMGGAMTGMTYYASLFYSLRVPGSGRGVRTGLHEGFIGAGILLGPLMGGTAAHLTSNLRVPYLLIILVIALTALVSLVIYRRPERSGAAVAAADER
ncbi:MAG: MFS transporter [Armatimonadota bacterium]